jgi:hypothetical protein
MFTWEQTPGGGPLARVRVGRGASRRVSRDRRRRAIASTDATSLLASRRFSGRHSPRSRCFRSERVALALGEGLVCERRARGTQRLGGARRADGAQHARELHSMRPVPPTTPKVALNLYRAPAWVRAICALPHRLVLASAPLPRSAQDRTKLTVWIFGQPSIELPAAARVHWTP